MSQTYALMLMFFPIISLIACIVECAMFGKSSDKTDECDSDNEYKRTE